MKKEDICEKDDYAIIRKKYSDEETEKDSFFDNYSESLIIAGVKEVIKGMSITGRLLKALEEARKHNQTVKRGSKTDRQNYIDMMSDGSEKFDVFREFIFLEDRRQDELIWQHLRNKVIETNLHLHDKFGYFGFSIIPAILQTLKTKLENTNKQTTSTVHEKTN